MLNKADLQDESEVVGFQEDLNIMEVHAQRTNQSVVNMKQ